MESRQSVAVQFQSLRQAPKGLRANTSSQFQPGKLLDQLISHMGLRNDAALSRMLELSAPTISKIRRRALPVSATVLVQMHEVSGLTIRDLRALMGDHRRRFGINDDEHRALNDVTTSEIR
jgi:hypothetical protein